VVPCGLFLFFFYTSVVGLSGTLVGIAAAIGLVWNALGDPIIGHASDRARSWLGRRHAFMLAGAATMGACFWALFSPPRGWSGPATFLWLIVTSLLFRLASSVFGIPYRALGAELSSDYHERTAISGIRGACGLVGLLLGSSLSFVLFFPNVTPGVDPKLRYEAYPVMGLMFGALMTVVALVPTLATLPRRHALAGDAAVARSSPGLRAGLV